MTCANKVDNVADIFNYSERKRTKTLLNKIVLPSLFFSSLLYCFLGKGGRSTEAAADRALEKCRMRATPNFQPRYGVPMAMMAMEDYVGPAEESARRRTI